jgi:hypothetical protein
MRASSATTDHGAHRVGRLRSAALVGAWALLCSALHFGGLAYDIYTRYWWWDLLTHSLSGFGVAGVAYVLRPAAFDARRVAYLGVPLAVFLVGAGFEVYEYLFKDFYANWSTAYYAWDTAVDLVLDASGAAVFALLARPLVRPGDGDGGSAGATGGATTVGDGADDRSAPTGGPTGAD